MVEAPPDICPSPPLVIEELAAAARQLEVNEPIFLLPPSVF
jgi:hypothetical protein